MRYLTDFDGVLMWRDEPQVEFSIRSNMVATVSVHGDHLPIEFRSKLTDKEAIYEFLTDRETPPTRQFMVESLQKAGIPYYDTVLLLRYNHGNTVNDDFWIKFSDEPEITFADAKPFRENYSAPKSVI